MNKFSAGGAVSTNNSSPGYQSVGSSAANGKSGKPDPIGLRATDAAVTRNWRCIIIYGILVPVVAVFAVVAFVYAVGLDKPYQVREDSRKNGAESRNVEIFLQNGAADSGSGTICSGVFIRSTGEILTAAHCLYAANPTPCNFVLTPNPHYATAITALTISVMNVNGTGAKYAFPGQVIAWSGITDIAIINPLPLTRSDGSVINVVNQGYYNFASGDLERGDTLHAFAYDNGFFPKAYRTGTVMHPKLDVGTLIAASTEQVFVDGISGEGASGSGWLSREDNLVVAPLSFGWTTANAYHPPSSSTPAATAGTSGTSYTVSKPLVNRMLDPNTPANGVSGQYLVPTLGIIVGGPVDAYSLWYNHGSSYYPETEMKGVIIAALATQTYYNTTVRCGSNVTAPAHTVTPPSLLNAPLDTIITGNPPVNFPAIPNGGNANTLVVLEAIEKRPNSDINGDGWVWMGSDAGLGTISGTILGNNFWVGDEIRVRIRAMNPVSPSDATQNWEAIYDVTLQAVDPFWDIAYAVPFATYASLVLVDDRTDPPTYVVPYGVSLPIPLRGTVPGSRGRPSADPFAYRYAHIPQVAEEPKAPAQRIVHASRDADTSALPTVVEHYLNQVAANDPSVRSEMERSRIARAEFLSTAQRHAPAMYRQSGPHYVRDAPARSAAKHQPASAPTHRKGRQAPSHSQQEHRRPGQHLKGRRN